MRRGRAGSTSTTRRRQCRCFGGGSGGRFEGKREQDRVDVGRFERELQGWVKDNRSSLLDDVAKARKKPELKALEEGLRDAIGTFKSSHWTAS